MKKTYIIIAVIIVAIVSTLLIANRKADAPSNSSESNESTTQDIANTSETTDATTAEGVTITYTDNGFSPSSVTLKAGQTVTVKNTSSRTIDFSSDAHPTHTKNTELNIGDVKPGATGTATVNNTGTWGYHDHNNSSETGTIIIN